MAEAIRSRSATVVPLIVAAKEPMFMNYPYQTPPEVSIYGNKTGI